MRVGFFWFCFFNSNNKPIPIVIRFVNVLVYYGLSLGVSRLGTNLYLTQFVFGLIEIPARSLVLLVLPCSRRLSQSGFLATGGLACLLMLAVPTGTTDTAFFVLSKSTERPVNQTPVSLYIQTPILK